MAFSGGRLKSDIILATEQCPGQSSYQRVTSWAEGVRARAAEAVARRQAEARASEVQQMAATARAAEESAAVTAADAEAAAREAEEHDWAKEAQMSLARERSKERRQVTRQWGGATSKVGSGRAVAMGGLFSPVRKQDESHHAS